MAEKLAQAVKFILFVFLFLNCNAEAVRWVGKASAEITGVKADKIWPLVADFCNIYRWVPAVDTSRCVEDGLFRVATSTAFPTVDGSAQGNLRERLVELNPTRMRVRYQIMENNVGFPVGGYFGSGQVKKNSRGGCTLIWSFNTVPIPGFRLEDLRASLQSTAQIMAQRMEAAAKAT